MGSSNHSTTLKNYTKLYLNAMRVHLLNCSHSYETGTSFVHGLQFHLRLKAVR